MFYFCWIKVTSADVTTFAAWSLFLYYVPHFLVWSITLVVNIVAMCILKGSLPASSETRKHILKQNIVYVLILGIETTLTMPFWVAQLILSHNSAGADGRFCFHDDASYALAVLFATVHSLRGTVDLAVWWFTFCIGPRDVRDLCQRIRAYRHKDLYLPDNTLTTPLVRGEDSVVNKNLRRDVMYCINYGILDAVRINAEEESQRTRLGSVRDPFIAHVMLKFEEENYQDEARKRSANPLYQEVHQRRIPFQPSESLKNFVFLDIEPTVFGLLRTAFKVGPRAYQLSFNIKDEQDVESSGMLEKFTEGKSGSFFYFTHDFRFIIKTVTPEEEAFLQKIAYQYYHHMKSNPDSVIVRLYGLHKVRLAKEQKYISVVVMDNIFYNSQNMKMHERYDLKGSTIGRKVLKGNERKASRFKKTLKDLDLHTPVVIGEEAKAQLMEQLKADVEFLSGLHIMDYSMLLGIHHHTDGESFYHPRSIPIEIEGNDFTVVNIGQQKPKYSRRADMIPVTPGATPTSTLDKNVIRRKGTGTSIFSDDVLSSMSLEEECRNDLTPHVPWFRQDCGGLRSYSPYHPTQLDQDALTSSCSITEGYKGFDTRSLPVDTYYFGIIDILQVYNWKKKAEHFTKTKLLCKDKYGISSVDQATYAERFLNAMEKIFQ